MAFVRELKAQKLDLVWPCPCGLRLDSLNRALLEAMKDAGCYEVAVGIESGDPRILRAMNKNSSPEKVEAMIRLIDEVGINVGGLIIVGYPGETKESLQRTMDYVLKLPLVRVSLTRFFPIRGTAVTGQLLSRGEIREEDLEPSKQNEGKFTYLTPELNEKTLRSLYKEFFMRFLLRPKIVWRNLTGIRSFSHMKCLLRRIWAYLK
jgi:radical SAM superfamily enzyme YgiQ (UPF0313 family)